MNSFTTPQWWPMAQKILEAYLPLRAFLALVQQKGLSLGSSVQLAITAIRETTDKLKVLSPGDRKRIEKAIDVRTSMLLTPAALLANILIPQHRGQMLTDEQIRQALKSIPKVCQDLLIDVPSITEVINFKDHRPPYADSPDCKPFQYWKAYMSGTPLSKLGELLSALPASQATVEKVFSSAGWQSEGRENLSSEHLYQEVFIRVNAHQLGYNP